ncbi:MAG: dipeptidase, partial [Gammaproteobacteria bacterium]
PLEIASNWRESMVSHRAMTRRDFVVATAGLAGLIRPILLDASAVQGTASDDQAREIYRRAIVIDGLLPDDFLSVLGRPAPPESPLFSQTQLDTVLRSGLTAGNLTVSGGTFERSARSIAEWMGLVEAHSSHFMFIRKHSDLARAKQDGKLGLILGLQNPVKSDDLTLLESLHGLGIRIIQLTYDTRTPFGDGCLEPANAGLSRLGREMVARMNELGIVVDLAHCGVQTTADAIAASTKPVIFSHTGCSEVFRQARNKEDRELRALADRGGVVGIYMIPFGLIPTGVAVTEEWLLRHVEHALKVCGADHVGIGSDVTLVQIEETPEYLQALQNSIAEIRKTGKTVGAEQEYIPGFNHPRRLESLAIALAKRGHSSAVIEKVIGGNFSRVFREIWGPGA